MLSARPASLALSLPVEIASAYTSFSTDEGVRSPRTPTYLPQSPSTARLPAFDHTKILEDSSTALPKTQTTPVDLPPTPDQPLAWIWVCHLCHSRYPLGVTRRCLVDGHYYCSGEANQQNLRKKKKRQSCSSEFDYVAWREWGDWKRKALKLLMNPRVARGCENCVFPSQCRYPAEDEKKDQVSVERSAKATGEAATSVQITPEIGADALESKDDAKRSRSTSSSNENVSFEQILGNIFPEEKSINIDPCRKVTFKKKTQGKRKNSQKHNFASSTEREMAREAEHVKQLVGVDLWNNLEDIDLGNLKAKLD
ncbi:uncharacterized protein A1O9_03545 [Exophiala aquamarina CBS 119918]|uniref:Uncharacterized protein n=1 Tax=Exophiala aquamarina CBS 119918 TaxID=1182545 RepID=A0A072PRL1_9EURO|nr:uncharacterized protein A1O9_03545 [Exophiala aquamarina CBS 119918]KEF61973.1 hypothetical protein A1O9_03545 [Exophiala aquamarina CBS 119918]